MILALLIVNTFALMLMTFSLYHLRKSIELNRAHTKTERAEVLDFVREKIAARLNDFRSGSGRDRLRERLSQRVAEANRSGTSDGARSADRPTTGVS